MSFDIDIVVFSNIPKDLPPDIEVAIGLPNSNPWSLPFAHKRLFYDRSRLYDLYIYSENDILITENNIRAFMRVSKDLRPDEIAGFFRVEKGKGDSVNFPEVHANFHWDPMSVCLRGGHTFAQFTNEHAACYLLTRAQLDAAIKSNGFLVPPHEGKYDLACSAATDPYTNCGLKKLVPISDLDNFLVHHLSDRYVGVTKESVGKIGVDGRELAHQIDALMDIGAGKLAAHSLLGKDIKPDEGGFAKSFHEPPNEPVLKVIGAPPRSILSIACGAGATEIELVKMGFQVSAIPLDPVVSRAAMSLGVTCILGNFKEAGDRLQGKQFDCMLFVNVLHLVSDPTAVLKQFARLLGQNSSVIVHCPNASRWPTSYRELVNRQGARSTTTRAMSVSEAATLASHIGFSIERIIWTLPKRLKRLSPLIPGFLKRCLATEFTVLARDNRSR